MKNKKFITIQVSIKMCLSFLYQMTKSKIDLFINYFENYIVADIVWNKDNKNKEFLHIINTLKV